MMTPNPVGSPVSVPRHNPLRGWGALPTHTRGNAADGVTPDFMAESPWDSRREFGQRATFGFPNETNVAGATSLPPSWLRAFV